MHKWDKRFMLIAKEVSTWSKDPSTKVGAVAVDNEKRIISTGYNGFPTGLRDDALLYENKECKHSRIIHAEMNVIYNAGRHGLSLKGCHLYVWGLPICCDCALGVIQSGISRVTCVNTKPERTEWLNSWEKTTKLFNECETPIIWELRNSI